MKSEMKVLFLHFASENRDAKAARLAKSGAQLIVEEPRWPRFYEVARREKPAAVVLDFSRAPSHALETADYLSKAKDTRDLDLFAIHVFDERRDLLKERVPRMQVYSERELSSVIADRLPKWETARAAAEQAAREERLQRAEERKASAAASRARTRELHAAQKAETGGAAAASPAGSKKAQVPATRPALPKKAAKKPVPKSRVKPVKKLKPPKKKTVRPSRKIAKKKTSKRPLPRRKVSAKHSKKAHKKK
jgi:hypothetical protein